MDLISSKYGAPGLQLAHPDASPLHTTTVMGSAADHPLSPDNPVLWIVGIGAVLLGLVSFTTQGRVGPLHASVSV